MLSLLRCTSNLLSSSCAQRQKFFLCRRRRRQLVKLSCSVRPTGRNGVALAQAAASSLHNLSSSSSISNDSPVSGLEEVFMGYISGKKRATEVAHQVWKHVVHKGDSVIDAICGNGFDTLAMLKLVADESGLGCVYEMDIQKDALENTSSLLDESVNPDKALVSKHISTRRLYWSVQATISWILSESFGRKNVSIVAEEDVETLSQSDSAGLLDEVVSTVNICLAEASSFDIQSPDKALGVSQVLEAINQCNSTGGPKGRHWVLDPVNGPLGFVRRDQYVVALALIEDGKVIIGVLGSPNYPMKKEWLNCHHPSYPIMSKLSNPDSDSWEKGCILYLRKGSGKAWMQPLIHGTRKLEWPNSARLIQVSSIDDPTQATFCEPVEKANSSHSFTAGLGHSVGLRNQPLRVHSMVKYAAIAQGDAEIFMKFAKSGYKEKIWDHSAGVLIVEEAGGMVTDAGGHPLDFSRGLYLEGLDRGIIVCSGATLHEQIIGAVYASWDSSNL